MGGNSVCSFCCMNGSIIEFYPYPIPKLAGRLTLIVVYTLYMRHMACTCVFEI